MFDTKIAILVLEDLDTWQKLNVTAFLASGVAGEAPDCMGGLISTLTAGDMRP